MRGLAIITPVCLQNEDIVRLYLHNFSTYRSPVPAKVFVLCNKLKIITPVELQKKLQKANGSIDVEVVYDVERSVAGAWNRGIELAQMEGFDVYHILANDAALHVNCISKLLKHIDAFPDVDMWSSSNYSVSSGSLNRTTACDFTSVLFKRAVIDKYGWFDREFKPAYCEDNDYVARVIMAGGMVGQCDSATHFHLRSTTIKLDPDQRHHSNHWFPLNVGRFRKKWGVRTDDPKQMLLQYNKTPFGILGKAISWWPEQDRKEYSVSGGIHT